MTDGSDATASGDGRSASALAMALAVMALGAFVAYDTLTGLAGPTYAEVGPGVFPLIIGAALFTAGVALLVQSLRGQWQVAWVDGTPSADARAGGPPEISPMAPGPRLREDERTGGTPLCNVLLVAAALTLNVLLFAPLGFIIASAVLFACVSAAFGSRRFIVDAAIGIAFAATIYVIFVHGLGLSLPAGSLWEGAPWSR